MDAKGRHLRLDRPVGALARIRRLLAVTALVFAGSADAAKVYVFYPSMARPNAVQAALAGRMSGNDVTVFGRLADFTAMMASEPPDVILVPKALADRYKEFKVFLRGARDGAPDVRAVLLSVEPVDPEAGSMDLGVVGILDRSAMTVFVGSMLGNQAKLKIVTKVEDLLPLLQFHSADAVLVGEDQVAEIKAKSAARLVSAPIVGVKWNLLVAAAKDDAARAVEPALRALGVSEKTYLGVDGWIK